jgi:hypothetical protein
MTIRTVIRHRPHRFSGSGGACAPQKLLCFAQVGFLPCHKPAFLGLFFTARGRGAGGKPQHPKRPKQPKVGAKATEKWGPKLLNTPKKWGPKLLKVGAKATEI